MFFTGNKIRSSGGNAIWEGLKANTALTELNLGVSYAQFFFFLCLHSRNELGDDGMKQIGEALKANTALTSLSISDRLTVLFCYSNFVDKITLDLKMQEPFQKDSRQILDSRFLTSAVH